MTCEIEIRAMSERDAPRAIGGKGSNVIYRVKTHRCILYRIQDTTLTAVPKLTHLEYHKLTRAMCALDSKRTIRPRSRRRQSVNTALPRTTEAKTKLIIQRMRRNAKQNRRARTFPRLPREQRRRKYRGRRCTCLVWRVSPSPHGGIRLFRRSIRCSRARPGGHYYSWWCLDGEVVERVWDSG